VARPADVAVIGGGIVGTATAAFLAEAGASVVLYEREALAAGASGRNSGVVQHPFDPVLVPLYEETLEVYRRVGEAVGRPIAALDAPPDGLLLVSHDRTGVLTLATELGRTFPALRPDFVEGPVLAALEPALGPDVVACRLDIGYPIIPSAPTYAFATLAEWAGLKIRLGRERRLQRGIHAFNDRLRRAARRIETRPVADLHARKGAITALAVRFQNVAGGFSRE